MIIKMKTKMIYIALILGLLLLAGCRLRTTDPVLDTDRCLKSPGTHCEVMRTNGVVNISINSIPNGTYYYNYSS